MNLWHSVGTFNRQKVCFMFRVNSQSEDNLQDNVNLFPFYLDNKHRTGSECNLREISEEPDSSRRRSLYLLLLLSLSMEDLFITRPEGTV